jgi:pimeloyl-ACP methyl ester carboxylesterase
VSWLTEVLAACGTRVRHLAGHSAGAHLALSYALAHGAPSGTPNLLDPTFCFTGMRTRYLLHALPTLVRPTERGVRATHHTMPLLDAPVIADARTRHLDATG